MNILARNFLLFFVVAGLVCLNSCGRSIASRPEVVPVNDYGLTDKKLPLFEDQSVDYDIINHLSDGVKRYLLDYKTVDKKTKEPIARFVALSMDGGDSFGDPRKFNDLFEFDQFKTSVMFEFAASGIVAAAAYERSVYVAKSSNGLSGWTKFTKITDSFTATSPRGIAIWDQSRMAVVWGDNRESEFKTYTSFTQDGGKTWSPDTPVEGELISAKQEFPSIAVGENGRLFCSWLDWRDEKTLADIRVAWSDDLGKSWSKSIKVNDDDLPVWQLAPKMLADGPIVSIVFADFRETGLDNDRDWNIYSSRSTDNGASWEPNKRVNATAAGRQTSSSIAKADNGDYIIVYGSSQNTLFGQVMIARSTDGGATWSKEVPLTRTGELYRAGSHKISIFAGGEVVVLTHKNMVDDEGFELLFAKHGGLQIENNSGSGNDSVDPIEFTRGGTTFEDDFSGKLADQWEIKNGIWNIVEGTYMGLTVDPVSPSSFESYSTYSKEVEPLEYVMSGKFKLDETAHTSAVIYFRSGKEKELVITNQFRHGSWLAIQDPRQPNSENFISSLNWTQTHLAENPFSFRSGTWYRFEIVVTRDQIDYRVDDQLRFSHKLEQSLPPGKIGLGGHASSPAYFDDIKMVEISR